MMKAGKVCRTAFSRRIADRRFWTTIALDIAEVLLLILTYTAFLSLGRTLVSSFIPNTGQNPTPRDLLSLTPSSLNTLYSLSLISIIAYLIIIFAVASTFRYLVWKTLLKQKFSPEKLGKAYISKAAALILNVAILYAVAKSARALSPEAPIGASEVILLLLAPFIATANMGLVALTLRKNSVPKAFKALIRVLWKSQKKLWKWYACTLLVFATISAFSLSFKLLPKIISDLLSFILLFLFVSWTRKFTLNYLFKKA